MTLEKVLEVIMRYRRKFKGLGVTKRPYPYDELLDSTERGLGHCHHMLDGMEQFISEHRVHKMFRWFGFIQGVCWALKIYTLGQLKDHSRPYEDPQQLTLPL